LIERPRSLDRASDLGCEGWELESGSPLLLLDNANRFRRFAYGSFYFSLTSAPASVMLPFTNSVSILSF
jgi:hypothetical protein